MQSNRTPSQIATKIVNTGEKFAQDAKQKVPEGLSGTISDVTDRLTETKDQLVKMSEQELDKLNEVGEKVFKEGQKIATHALKTFKERPFLSMMVGTGIGLLLGTVFARSLRA